MADSSLTLALRWREMRAARLAEQKKVDALKVVETELYEKLVANLKKSKSKAVSNGERLFQLVEKEEPFVDDWPKLYAHVQKTGEFELLFRRVNPAAVKERWEQKLKVPGVSTIPVEVISDTQAK